MRHSLRRTTVEAIVLALLGALLYGAAGTYLALRDYPLYETRAQVRLLVDPIIGDEATGDQTSETDDFIATQLVLLNAEDLEERVRTAQGGSDVELEAVQVGVSQVVEITSRSSDREDVNATETVLDLYVEDRSATLLDRIRAVSAQVDTQLASVDDDIAALDTDDSATAQVQRAALTNEYSRLLEQSNTLQLAAQSSRRLVQVVNTAEGLAPRQVAQPVRNGVLGAGLGAGLGLVLAIGLGRLRRRVSGLDDLLDLSPELALPTMPHLHGHRLAGQAGNAASTYVSALTGPGGHFGRPPLVVIAPTVGCGATFVAVGLAVASARRGPTVLLAAADALDGSAARMLGVDLFAEPDLETGAFPTDHDGLVYLPLADAGSRNPMADLDAQLGSGALAYLAGSGRAVVVDAPALSAGGAGLELARQSGQVLLVGGVDTSSAAELDAAARTVKRMGSTLVGVVLSSPRTRLLSWRRRR